MLDNLTEPFFMRTHHVSYMPGPKRYDRSYRGFKVGQIVWAPWVVGASERVFKEGIISFFRNESGIKASVTFTQGGPGWFGPVGLLKTEEQHAALCLVQ